MNNKNAKLIFGLIVLVCACFTACENPIIKTWWDGPPPPISNDPVYHTVQFEANGGLPAPGNQLIAHGGKIAKLPVMSKDHYGFGGWYTEADVEWDFAADTVDNELTLYAQWRPISFVITFEADGGSPPPGSQGIIEGGKIVEPPPMSRPGYGFGGWYTEDVKWDFSTGVDDTNTADRKLTLYARWEEDHYTVTFVEDGGSPPPIDQRIAYGGSIVEPLAMSRSGYSFGGWYTDSDFSDEWNFASPVTSHLTLYASWFPVSYTVTFEANGGEPVPAAQLIIQGGKIVEPAAMSLAGQGFDGWYTDSGFTNKWNFAADAVSGNVTLYARWDTPFNTVTFDANGGVPAPAQQLIIQGGKIVEPAAMSLAGHGFDGWYTDSGFTTKWNFAADTVTSTITLYAKWHTDYRTVTFDAGGGTPAPGDQQIAVNGRIVEPAAMSRAGYGFGGWFKDNGFAIPWNFAVDTVTENVTLYARWTLYQALYHYTVTFNANGGSPAPANQDIYGDTKAARPAPMSKTGSSFGGWYTDTEFTDEWNFDTKVPSNITLYAMWKANPSIYTVTFNADPGVPQNQSRANPWPAPQSIVDGAKAVEPSAMRKATAPGSDEWYGFGGWFKDSGFTILWNFAVDPVTEDITLYARWLPPSHHVVIFEANGGDPAPRSQDLIDGTRVVEPLVMSRPGYGFGGWYKDPSFTEQWDFTANTVTGDLTLYAYWVTNYYTVTFDADGGTPEPASQTVAHGSTVTTPSGMRKPDKGFVGWYMSDGTEWDFTRPVITDLALYAQWGDEVYTVIFNLKSPPGSGVDGTSGHGNPVPDDQYLGSNGKVSEPPPVNLAGWSFAGWYYSDSSTVNPENVSNNLNTLREWDFDQPVTEDFTNLVGSRETLYLYARWVPYVPGFVWVRKGNFTMGDDHISGSSPARNVKLSGYYMSLYAVSQENYVSVTGLPNPSQFTMIDTRPVEKISWYDAIEYCNIRSVKDGLSPAYSLNGSADPADWGTKPTTSPSNWDNIVMNADADGYRLPTEAEWEYAARGGNGSPGGFTYAGSNNADDVAWYNLNSGGVTHPIGTRAPNGLGIYDMSGNVSEWCWDWFAPYSDLPNSDVDPAGASSGTERVRRGGAYSNNYTNVRTVIRNSFTPDDANWVMGFRVVRGPEQIY